MGERGKNAGSYARNDFSFGQYPSSLEELSPELGVTDPSLGLLCTRHDLLQLRRLA